METRTGNAEPSDAGTSDASGFAEATASEATNASDATATAPVASLASATGATNASDRAAVDASEPIPSVPTPSVAEPEPASTDADAPRVLSPASKWRVLRTRVRAMSFVERVGKMAAHARPSKLQALAALPNRSAADTVHPSSAARGAFVRGGSAAKPAAPVDAATFTFTGALDVPDAELDREVSHVTLRACLCVGGELVGAVAAVPATRTSDAAGVAAWRFGRAPDAATSATFAEDDAYHLLARTDRRPRRSATNAGASPGGSVPGSSGNSGSGSTRDSTPGVELRVELNVVPVPRDGGERERGARGRDGQQPQRESRTETLRPEAWFGAPPASFFKKPPLVSARRPDEVCVAWGRVPWPDVVSSGKPAAVDVALRGGGASADDPSADDPEGVLLPASDRAKAKSAGFFAKFTEKGKRLRRGPTVSVRVAPPPPRVAAAAAKLPRETLCASQFVPLLATFLDLREREARAVSTGTTGAGKGVSSNPALTTIPACLRDEHLADALADAFRRARSARHAKHAKRKNGVSTETRVGADEDVEILETLALKFWPLLRTGALRAARVDAFASGDAKARRRRALVIEKSVSRRPRESLSRESDSWIHEPFSVAELRHVFP